MRLTAIKLAGFKSFVDVTTLPLPTNLSAVVGPNGSGKSNLIDAVRWVLGESSAKSLRGVESEDVIFNGARGRKPAGRASVELLFDNADGTLQGAYGSYAEISVRREVVRGDSSQYFINNQKCLKRDVVDLFLGTGLGGRNNYAILEQGSISRLVDAKPEELRLWLEEAAGISRYKDRRRETESRIRQTRENLERLRDLEGEIAQRLTVLTRQAADAEKYRDLKQQERLLKAEVLLLRQRGLEAQSAAQQAAIQQLDTRLEAARAALASADAQRAQADAAQRAAAEALNGCQGEVYQSEAALARDEQALAHARELQTLHGRELLQIEGQLAEADARQTRETQRRDEVLQALQDAQRQSEAAVQGEQVQIEAARHAEQTLAEVQAQWESFNQRAQAPLLEAEGGRARLQGLERAAQQVEERQRRLEQERGSLDATPLQTSLFDADADLQTLEREITNAQTALQSIDEELQGLREQRATRDAALHEARRALQDARGREASLETLQQAALRQDDAALGQWLDQRGWSAQPQLATAIRVTAGWEAAVEHVLAGVLQAPLLPEWEPVQLPDRGPDSGAVLAAGHDRDATPDSGTLADCVEGPAVVREWLGAVHRVADVQDAAARLAGLPAGASLITPDGVWRGRGWVRYPRGNADHSGVIARGQLLRELRSQAETLQDQVTALEQTLEQLRNRSQALEAERRSAASRFDQARSQHGRRLADRQAQAVRLEQIQGRIQSLGEELDALAAQRQQQASELSAVRERLAELERAADALRAERSDLQQTLAQSRERAQQARGQLQAAAQARSSAQVRLAAQGSALSAVDQTLQDLAEQIERLQQRRSQGVAGSAELEQPILEHSARVEQARARLATVREQLRAAREQLSASEAAAEQAQRALRSAETERDAALERLQQARLEFESQRARREALDAQLAETGEDVVALAAALDAGATMDAWEQKLAQTLRRIERLGAINLAAIPELEEARARAEYLAAQHRDLDEALATLEDAMRKLDRETQERFRNTFERVDAMFRERCPRLFGGGEAYLEMVGDDWLSAGVRVMARPPGKRNATIQLLSGGEKALVALALLFALFELNPAPFCLLDEVEAPLDDANVGRFCELVREMSQRVQFIIITHNKITMELAEHLHGVTMQEPGVSRLVSVDVQQATSLVEPPVEPAEV